MLVIGIDDAGRGPIIGPMILSGVLMRESEEKELKKRGIKDSKLLSHCSRIRLAGLIREKIKNSCIVKLSPEEIDLSIKSGTNLNTLEAMKMAEIINNLNPEGQKVKVIVDCPSVNIERWSKTLIGFIKHSSNLEILCEHKADFNHPSVSAASILAKVERENEIEKLKEKYGEIGSGYPSDPKTKEFLRKYGKKLANSGIFRKSWSTWKMLFPENKQLTLRDF